MVAVNTLEMRKMIVGEEKRGGASFVATHLCEKIANKEIPLTDISIRQVAEAFLGYEFLAALTHGRRNLVEATNAVDTSAFSKITGQILFRAAMDAYEDPAFLWPSLCKSEQSNLLNGEKIPGISKIGDEGSTVQEATDYPVIGLSENYIETARMVKRGFIVKLTKEILIADLTGKLVSMAASGGQSEGIALEKRVLDCVVGTTNNYKRNGTSVSTYQTATPFINKINSGNALYDWKNLETAELLFDALTDPDTGEPIMVKPNTLIVPSALLATARRIIGATSIEHVDNTASATSVRTTSPNPTTSYTIISSPYVKARTTSATRWFLGDPKRAFLRTYAWDIETAEQSGDSGEAFRADIMSQYKVSVMDAVTVVEPRAMVQSNA